MAVAEKGGLQYHQKLADLDKQQKGDVSSPVVRL
jgi:hypothetical protein